MKLFSAALVAALAASTLAVPSTASARPHRDWRHDRHHHGWNHGHHRPRHCWWTWRHHHRIRVCR